jgi:glutamyl-tRNA reductase
MQDYLPSADIVITQTAAEGRILDKKAFLQSQKKRGFASVFVLDLAVPRDVSEDVGELEGVFLYNVDDLEQVVAEHAMERSRELEQCRAIIADETTHFLKGFHASAAGPLITELRSKADAIREEEMAKLLAKFPDLPPEAQAELKAFSARLMNKLLHPHIQEIKDSVARAPSPVAVDPEVTNSAAEAGKETP